MTAKNCTLTQKRLKEVLHYNSCTGVFTWKIRLSKCIHIGSVAGYKSHGYLLIRINYNNYRAHRLAFLYMNGLWPKEQVDHINHKRDDNRFSNLREATDQENKRNYSILKSNTSGCTGVNKENNRWRARIKVDYKLIHIGVFDNWFDAVCARKSAEVKYKFHKNHGVNLLS